ncbi:MAG: hypothetical protein HQ557_18990 [Bacteroidetes bacterium]|nr:hypothetical protein [Bacteroidota bacterium]
MLQEAPPHPATQAERKSAIEHEFFEITDEIKEAIKRARIENRYPAIDGTHQSELHEFLLKINIIDGVDYSEFLCWLCIGVSLVRAMI